MHDKNATLRGQIKHNIEIGLNLNRLKCLDILKILYPNFRNITNYLVLYSSL